MVTYLVPVMAVPAGMVVLGKRLSWIAVAGGVIVVTGIYLAQHALSKTTTEAFERVPR